VAEISTLAEAVGWPPVVAPELTGTAPPSLREPCTLRRPRVGAAG
jgi:hypothetical protein